MLKRTFSIRTFPVAVALALGLTYATPVRAAMMDFDTTGPTTTADIPNFFDLLGSDPNIASNWNIDPNTWNPADNSNALHTITNGNALEKYFSRVAILKSSVFEAEDFVYSADVTWDNDNDTAGLLFRFTGNSDVPLENTYYSLRLEQGNSTLTLTRVKDGVASELFNANISAQVTVATTGTLNMKVEAVDDSISVFLDDIPILGLDPFLDGDPILGLGRVGVGQETNPTFFDNLSMEGAIPEPGSATLLALGMLGLLGWGRRRRRGAK